MEFKEEKELLKIKRENQDKKHKQHLKEIEIQKELELTKFQHSLELQRIKTAEIRKMQQRKAEIYRQN